jgi:hypothetical protein
MQGAQIGISGQERLYGRQIVRKGTGGLGGAVQCRSRKGGRSGCGLLLLTGLQIANTLAQRKNG